MTYTVTPTKGGTFTPVSSIPGMSEAKSIWYSMAAYGLQPEIEKDGFTVVSWHDSDGPVVQVHNTTTKEERTFSKMVDPYTTAQKEA